VLTEIHRQVPDAIVIGGWAAYLLHQGQKSHDIDLIVDMAGMSALQRLHRLEPRGHLGGRKYKVVIREVGVDIYAAYQSELGQRLRLPVEVLIGHARTVAGHRSLRPEALLTAKMAALLDRPDTLPGEKDRQDIWAILHHDPAGWRSEVVADILRQTNTAPASRVPLVEEAFGYLEEIDSLTRVDKQFLRRARDDLLGELTRRRSSGNRSASELERE
jgi:hypothetical protein